VQNVSHFVLTMRSINSRDILRKKLRYNLILVGHCCGSGMFIPDPISHIRLFFHPGSDFYHPGSRIRIKEVSILAQKMVFKLQEK
jgi:hypothetical protein